MVFNKREFLEVKFRKGGVGMKEHDIKERLK